jgi:hypothetical protein
LPRSLNGSIVPLEGTAEMAGISCHEFEATDNRKVCHMMEGKEFKVKQDKTLIYPCRVKCPCTMCRDKIGYCEDFEEHDS